MQLLYRKVTDADAIIIGAPIYVSEMNAQTKLFIDRMYGLFKADLTPNIDGNKKFVFVFCHGMPDGSYAQYFDSVKNTFIRGGFDVAILSAGSVDALGEVRERHDIINAARKMGKRIATSR